ncbi:alpha/beta hydrolase [Maritalea mediterranea]|uniref:Alpha/beta hydrolase n=1 Tax=Maritalea mediterranea TaxID=2909667 RepID=A0ABS9E7X1_9HYPH|nr:alpha/beta hydrolase [Maritalea mediterranea]MCF4098946.1 alpha/beta hydrolase [Maritalea mediterranea]
MAGFTIEHNGARLYGVEQGFGAPVVFLHAGVADHRMWLPQLDAMDMGIQAIAYDRRGFGRTTSEDVVYSELDDLLVVLNHFRIGRAVLVGCSQGGGLAAAFALRYPDRVGGLMLVAASYTGMPDLELEPGEKHIAAQYDAMEAETDLEAFNQFEARVWLDGVRAEEGRVGAHLRALFLDMNGQRLRHKRLSQKQQRPETYSRLPEIDVPMLLVAGGYDSSYYLRLNAQIAQEARRAEAQVMPKTGHLPNMEDPETFNGLLSSFLATL